MMRRDQGVLLVPLLLLALCGVTPVQGRSHPSFEPKQHGQPATQRRRLRKHKEVVQLPKGRAGHSNSKASKKNSYQHDPDNYPAYLSGFYGYEETDPPQHQYYYPDHPPPQYPHDDEESHFPETEVPTSFDSSEQTEALDYPGYGSQYHGAANNAAQHGDDYYGPPPPQYYYPQPEVYYQEEPHYEYAEHPDAYHYYQPPTPKYYTYKEPVEYYQDDYYPGYPGEEDAYAGKKGGKKSSNSKGKKSGGIKGSSYNGGYKTAGKKAGGSGTKAGAYDTPGYKVESKGDKTAGQHKGGDKVATTKQKIVTTKYTNVKSYKKKGSKKGKKGKKASYYHYEVKEEILHGGVHKEVIHKEVAPEEHAPTHTHEETPDGEEYDNVYEQVHQEIHDGILGPVPVNVHQELHEMILEEAYNAATEIPDVGDYHYHAPTDDVPIVEEYHYHPAAKGAKGYSVHSRSKSSSSPCNNGKGKKKSKGNKYYSYWYGSTEVDEGCSSSKSKSKKASKKNSKSKSGMKIYNTLYPTFAPRDTSFPTFEGSGPTFGDMTAVPSASQPGVNRTNAPISMGGDVPTSIGGDVPTSMGGETDEPNVPTALIPVEPEDPSTGEPTLEGTPAQTEAGTAAPTALLMVELVPFGLLYDISRDDIPPMDAYEAAGVVTAQCLDNYFSTLFNPEAQTFYTGGDFIQGSTAYSLLSGALIDFSGIVTFSDIGIIPTPEGLDVTIEEAFTGANLDACMALLAAELPPENLFSTVINIRKVESSTMVANARKRRYPSSPSTSFSMERAIFMTAAFGMLGLLCYVGIRMWMGSRQEGNIVKGGAYFGGEDILLGDNYNGYLVER